jgi:predicted dehydrogenase
MAWADVVAHLGHESVDLVAVAEVDARRMDKLAKQDPDKKVRVYRDWRELLEKESKQLDAVNIGTPDHMHAPMGVGAMACGLHTYIQKPLAHDLYEVRRLTEIAKERRLVSQMGIQVHSSGEYQTAVQVIRSGVVGKIREVHTWSNKKWGDSAAGPKETGTVPEGLAWDLWLGVAAERPYAEGAYIGGWRKRVDFGTGTFGDMGCHIYDPVFEALGLGAPIRVRSEGAAPNAWSWATDAVIHYEFPGTEYTEGKTVKVIWYDGDQRPPAEIQALLEGEALPGQGSIFVGSKGVCVLPHVGWPKLFPVAQFKDFRYERVAAKNHRAEFFDAILNGTRTSASFDYSGPLTEAVLLGGVATYFPRKVLEWDSQALTFKGDPEASALVRRRYRKGWEVPGLS